MYTLGVAAFAAIGTFFFGFDTGIATTTIAHESWVDYMGNPSKGLTGSVVAVYIAGKTPWQAQPVKLFANLAVQARPSVP